MPRAQEAHDCRDAGGRATQEQLPRSGVCQFRTESLNQRGRRGRKVPFSRTRHKHVRVGSGATSMSLTVRSKGTLHPLLRT